MTFFNKIIRLISIGCAFSTIACSQTSAVNTFKYKPISSQVSSYYQSTRNAGANFTSGAIDISKYLKAGMSINQVTQTIQLLINKNGTILLPNYKITIAKEGLDLKSNSIIIFQPKSQVQIESNALSYYQILKIHNVENVKIFNARLIGDRVSHKSKEGQWGYGISIRQSKNILIDNFYIDDLWGDGIAIGYGSTKPSYNITITNGVIDKCRRNGLSIMNVKGLAVKNLFVANTNGTKPMFGIDMEPNRPEDELDEITLNNIKTYNNASGGMMITYNKLKSAPKKLVNISVNNYNDIGSNCGLYLAGVPKGFTGISGKLMLSNVRLENNTKPLIGRENNNSNYRITLDNVDVISPKNKNANKAEMSRIFNLKKNYRASFKK